MELVTALVRLNYGVDQAESLANRTLVNELVRCCSERAQRLGFTNPVGLRHELHRLLASAIEAEQPHPRHSGLLRARVDYLGKGVFSVSVESSTTADGWTYQPPGTSHPIVAWVREEMTPDVAREDRARPNRGGHRIENLRQRAPG